MQPFAILKTENSDLKTIEELATFLKVPVINQHHENISFYLQVIENRIQLVKFSGLKIPGPKPIEVDFLSDKWNFKIKTLSKSQPLFKSIGLAKTPLHVFDVTAGLGEDSFSFLSKGCKVTAFEKNPAIFSLLKNGFDRLRLNIKWTQIIDENFKLICTDSFSYLKKNNEQPDVIYIDPMYADVGSASPKKEMSILREFLPADDNIESLLDISLKTATKRVVVKRAAKTKYLSLVPTHSFEGRTTRYDMYSVT